MGRHGRWLGGLLVALMIAGLVSPWASPWPDGLERVAERLGFQEQEREQPLIEAPMPEYRLPASGDAGRSTALAGIAGTLVVFAAASLAGRALARRRSEG